MFKREEEGHTEEMSEEETTKIVKGLKYCNSDMTSSIQVDLLILKLCYLRVCKRFVNSKIDCYIRW